MTQIEIVFDALAPYDLAHFWADALPGYSVRPYDDAEIARLLDLGLTPKTDPSVPIDGDGPTVWFQSSRSSSTSRNRIHLDVKTANRDALVQRLKARGASIRDQHDAFTVMLDPEGNQFCVVDADGETT